MEKLAGEEKSEAGVLMENQKVIKRYAHTRAILNIAAGVYSGGTVQAISSKFALEGLSECMRYEMSPFGIKTIIIEPGVIQTNFFSSMKVAEGKPNSPYKETTEKVMNGKLKLM